MTFFDMGHQGSGSFGTVTRFEHFADVYQALDYHIQAFTILQISIGEDGFLFYEELLEYPSCPLGHHSIFSLQRDNFLSLAQVIICFFG